MSRLLRAKRKQRVLFEVVLFTISSRGKRRDDDPYKPTYVYHPRTTESKAKAKSQKRAGKKQEKPPPSRLEQCIAQTITITVVTV